MRIRPIAFLSTVAAATLVLAGCSGDQTTPESSPTPEASSACVLDEQPGAGSDAVVVDGEGTSAKVTIPKGTEINEVERTVVKEGDGEDVHVGDLVSLRYQLVDATTSEVLGTSERGPDGVLPALLSAQQPPQISDFTQSSIFVVAVECLPIGSQVVLTLPSSVLGEGATPVVLYAETVEKLPTVATGADVKPTEGMPTVKLDDAGAPTITIPDTAPPTETKVALLKEGDGPTVEPGNLVTVQYRGVKWEDGEEFDASWTRGAVPAQFPTSGVVTGFRLALEGQKVGSQVIVTMPPKDGYAGQDSPLKDSTLVFVVDILGTTPLEN